MNINISIEQRLNAKYGEFINLNAIALELGYPSINSLRVAIHRGKVPIRTFLISGRKGRFALKAELIKIVINQASNLEVTK